MEQIGLAPVDEVTITVVVDNFVDALAPAGPGVTRLRLGDAPSIPSAVLDGGQIGDLPGAEHGYSALVTVRTGARERRILFDAGMSPDGAARNLGRLGIDAGSIEAIVLSHGHFDHTTGMDGIAHAVGARNLPVVVHPGAWSRRRIVIPGRDPWELPTTSPAALRDTGFEIVEQRRPSLLLDGSVLVTGEVDRTTDFETGLPPHQALRDGSWEPDPLILDDQALIVSVRDRGLVVLTGCGHSGIVNICRYAARLTGAERIAAVAGGFHLPAPLFIPAIPQVVSALRELAPDHLLPGHCVGLHAISALLDAFPDELVQPSVGTSLRVVAPDAGR